MYGILYTRDFKKSLKKLQKSGKMSDKIKGKLEVAIDTLVAGNELSKTYRDHQLKGVFKDKRECHIKGDLVLVYKREEDALVLIMVEIGTHSQIFG